MPKNYQQGCVTVVALDERLTADEADEVTGALNQALGAGLPQVVIDLHTVQVADSVGLERLCEFHDECRRRGGEARLSSPGRLIRDVLRVTGIDEQIGVSENVISAAGEFAK